MPEEKNKRKVYGGEETNAGVSRPFGGECEAGGRPLHIDKVESKSEIWRRITRPGLFDELEISNSPNR